MAGDGADSSPLKSLSGGGWGGFSLPFERVSLALVLNEFENELIRMKIWSVFNQPIEKINQNNIFSLSKNFNKNVTLKFGSTILNWRLVGRIIFGHPPHRPPKRIIIYDLTPATSYRSCFQSPPWAKWPWLVYYSQGQQCIYNHTAEFSLARQGIACAHE